MTSGFGITMRLSVATFLLIATYCAANEEIEENEENEENDEASRVRCRFNANFLCPYYIDEPPPAKLSVKFSTVEVDLGNQIPAYSACMPPYIYYDSEPDKLHSIVMFDCDSPSVAAPVDSQCINALLVNIKGNNLAGCDYMTTYVPVAPYVGSGSHRYVILLFRQPEEIDITTPEMQNRHKNLTNFNVKAFASQYGLELVAGNFFYASTNLCDDEDDAPIVCSV